MNKVPESPFQRWIALSAYAAQTVANAQGWSIVGPGIIGTNVVYRAQDHLGLSFAIRVGQPAQAERMANELSLAKTLIAQSVPACRPLSLNITIVKAPNGELVPVSLWCWEKGIHQPRGRKSLFRLGVALRRLHDAAIAGGPEHIDLKVAHRDLRWRNISEAIRNDPRHPWHDRPDLVRLVDDRLQTTTLRFRQLLDSMTPRVFLHGDLGPSNLLFSRKRITILDFDFASPGPLHCDFADLAQTASIGSFSADDLREILRGYGDRLPKRSEMVQFGEMYGLLLLLWRIEETYRGTHRPMELDEALCAVIDSPQGSPKWFAACEVFPT